jgi:pyruvate carboxylase
MYAEVNRLLGDIVKVTPSSKVVGDLAIYMLTHDLTPQDLLARAGELQLPESIVGLFAGEIGYPEGGFPPRLQAAVLKGRAPVEGRLGAHLPPVDLEATRRDVERRTGRSATDTDALSYLMYSRVFLDFAAHRRRYADVAPVPTEVFFYGMEPGQETEIEIEEGKTLFVKLIARTPPNPRGMVTLFFELNGHPREVEVPDHAAAAAVQRHPKADPENLHHVGAPMPGAIVDVAVKVGDSVEKDRLLLVIEAMKMQMHLNSPVSGKVKELLVAPGSRIETGDLLVVFA